MFLQSLHCLVVKCSDVSEESTAPIVRVAEEVQVDAKVTYRKKLCQLYRTVQGSLTNQSYGRQEEGLGLP
jgi:hypothetical protein